jgi:hypothetical protein
MTSRSERPCAARRGATEVESDVSAYGKAKQRARARRGGRDCHWPSSHRKLGRI